ncbi:MAG TPA: hypothetical protein VM121_01765 [Acidimicrobiales bacterium]|nr:hypothetical protein [Acidimicrobiales bacterium]
MGQTEGPGLRLPHETGVKAVDAHRASEDLGLVVQLLDDGYDEQKSGYEDGFIQETSTTEQHGLGAREAHFTT